MISNERPSSHGQRPYGGYQQQRPKRNVEEESLRTEKLQVERKTFIFTLKENVRGRFLRITEDVNGRRDTIILPTTGLEDFKKVLEGMAAVSEEISAKDEVPGEAAEGESSADDTL
ncbi:MAG: hypothetical protein ACI9VS_003702 [Candidatus Binatia bacterium]|jgi:hypothetical protein